MERWIIGVTDCGCGEMSSKSEIRDSKSKIANLRSKILSYILYFLIIGLTLVVLYPIINVFSISLRPGDRLLSTSLRIIPDGATFHAYKELFTQTPFL
ncbi:MAG TPA: hypothetical protein PL001_12240, partial [Candidatus Kryptobacter bacterium]|nr:hypothetical protein [Candidatus Kryptobacter bacterium]